jgi:hypothetical protein
MKADDEQKDSKCSYNTNVDLSWWLRTAIVVFAVISPIFYWGKTYGHIRGELEMVKMKTQEASEKASMNEKSIIELKVKLDSIALDIREIKCDVKEIINQ